MSKFFDFSKWCLNEERYGLFLYATGAISSLMGTAAHVAGIYWDKNVDKKTRDFLVPQVITNGILNQICLFSSTFGLMKLTDKLMKDKKIGFLNQDKISPDKMKLLRGGVNVFVATAASILTNNVFGPFIKNNVGAYFQKKAQKKDLNENLKKDEHRKPDIKYENNLLSLTTPPKTTMFKERTPYQNLQTLNNRQVMSGVLKI